MRAMWVLGGVLGLAFGCQRPSASSKAAVAEAAVASSPVDPCDEDLGGVWVSAADPSFRYDATDDGGTLTLTLRRVRPADAGFRPRVFRDAGQADADGGALAEVPQAPAVVLKRTPDGFTGATRVTAQRADGRECEAHFPVRVEACAAGRLTLSATPALTLDDVCQTTPANAVRQVLERRPGG